VALESARRLRLVAPEAVLRRLDELGTRGRAGAAVLRPLLEAARTRPALESRLEVKVARLLRGAGLPEPERQWKVSVGGRRYRLDFAWPSRRVALEADGRASHATPRAFQRDRTRWTLLASAGWRVMVVTWEDATRRAREVVDQVSAALRIPS
jgi:very-short-patch-repair endonuclease